MRYRNERLLLEAMDEINESEHKELSEEYSFYQAVTSGDVAAVRKSCEEDPFLDSEGVGVLSRNPVTNLKYHFVITVAMIARLCQQKGMELELAFRMSDFYIQKLDDIHTIEDIRDIHQEMALDYTEEMRKICERDTGSKHIKVCKDYIYSHIKERITIEGLAERLGVSASYLSRLFKKETGCSVSVYIREQKIEMAKNLLRYSDYALIDIANHLSFSSQSHFIQQFREQVGMTPKKYRDMNQMFQWELGGGRKRLIWRWKKLNRKRFCQRKTEKTGAVNSSSPRLFCSDRDGQLCSRVDFYKKGHESDILLRFAVYSGARIRYNAESTTGEGAIPHYVRERFHLPSVHDAFRS